MRSANGLKKFKQESRYPHHRSEGTALRRYNGATKQLIKEKTVITLAKGDEAADLGGVQKLQIGVSWDASDRFEGQQFGKFFGKLIKKYIGVDLDLVAVAMSKGEPVRMAGLSSRDPMGNGSLYHTGDERTGNAAGDDEQIHVTFADIPSPVESIVFIASAFKDGTSFGDADNVSFKVYDATGGNATQVAEIWPSLRKNFNACAIAKAVRVKDSWEFEVIEQFGNVRQGDRDSLMRFAMGK